MVLINPDLLTILVVKCVITLAAVIISANVSREHALPAAVGGFIAIINDLYYTFRFLRTTYVVSETVQIRGLLLTQLSKYAFCIILIFTSLGVFKLAAVPLLGTFMISQIAYFFVATKRRD